LKSEAAFSLLEVLVATAITIGMGAAAFKLFHQNERLFRDQALRLEMQQSVRMAASQVADDIRLAGQAIPPGLGWILPGSGASRLNLRTGFSATETVVTSPAALSLALGTPTTVFVESTSGFSSGRQAFLWTETEWARVTINSISGAARSVRVTPSATSITPLVFIALPALSLDEAVSVYRDAVTNTLRRTTSTNTVSAASPVWAPANELAANVSDLAFFYYDSSGSLVTPDTDDRRALVVSIEARVTVSCSATLSDGSRPTTSQSVRVTPRNLQQ
jgi:hypothetical protein